MLIYLYLFSLIVGGVLLGASILLGGQDSDADADADFDADADADFDAQVDGDFDAHGEVDADHGGHGDHDHHGSFDGAHGSFDFFLTTFRSVRFWTYFLAFFGLTGLVMDGLGLVGSQWIALALAIAMGSASGLGVSAVFRKLAMDETGHVPGAGDYIGKTVRAVVPVEKDGTGKVRLQLAGNTVDVLAVTDEDEPFDSREEAMIIEMEGTRARIARVRTHD
jgi:hypothetical protein